MAQTLTSKFTVLMSSILANVVGPQSLQAAVDRSNAFSWASGTSIDTADRIYTETRTLAASGNVTLDLAGSLLDAFGAVCTFARVKLIMIAALAANTNNVILGAAAATQFLGPLGTATDTLNVRPGGLALLVAPDAVAWAVGAGATDFLKFTNSGAGTGVTYDLVIVGASA